MPKELKLGDKLWMHYGASVLIVGHIVDVSPSETMIGISPLPYDDYKEMTFNERASCPISWCETKACHYLSHVPYDDMKKHDEGLKPALGFSGPNGGRR